MNTESDRYGWDGTKKGASVINRGKDGKPEITRSWAQKGQVSVNNKGYRNQTTNNDANTLFIKKLYRTSLNVISK